MHSPDIWHYGKSVTTSLLLSLRLVSCTMVSNSGYEFVLGVKKVFHSILEA